MSRLYLEPTVTAHWHSLVLEAEQKCDCQLSDELESYLVFLLMRFADRTDIANSIMALEYLKSMKNWGKLRQDGLRDVGDRCLLFSGLYPQRAKRKRVKISYFVDLGRSAYGQLSETCCQTSGRVYKDLAIAFVTLMDILLAIRELSLDVPLLTPLEALELWQDTGSKRALKAANSISDDGILILGTDSKSSH
ncbi:MAG: hypothetical protein OEZ43_02890 [Gammaproteobacteria bacterium]|nr:hypothetical protein [Gammaproteobacteria bacterium]